MAAQDIYLPRSFKTSLDSTGKQTAGGQHAKYTIDFTQYKRTETTASGTKYIILEHLPQGSIVTFTRLKFTVPFVGPSLTTIDTQAAVGTVTYATGLPVVTLLSTMGGALRVTGTVSGTEGTTAGGINTDLTGKAADFASTGNATGVSAVFAVQINPVGAAATVLTAGSLDVWFDYIVLGA